MIAKYLILAISFGEKIKNFYIIIICCYSTFCFCYIYIPKKMQRIEQKIKKEKLERDVIASYLSDLTRFQHRMKRHRNYQMVMLFCASS